jgi:hypothetical protein
MRKKLFYITSVILFCSISFLSAKQDKNIEEFKKEMQSVGVEFKMPKEFLPVEFDPEKCEDVKYYYAIKHKIKKLEIRFSLYPYVKSVKEPNQVIIGSDNSYKAFTFVVLVNIAGEDKNILKSTEFFKDAVKKEFNADWGSSFMIKPESKFGKNYKTAMVVSLYKSGYGYIYVTYLFDDFKEIYPEFMASFHSIRFTDNK